MKVFANLMEATFMLFVGWFLYSYYAGRLNLSEKAEKARQKKMKNLGWLFIILSIGSTICGFSLILLTLWPLVQ